MLKPLSNYILMLIISIIVYGAIAIAVYPAIHILAPVIFALFVVILIGAMPISMRQETVYFTKFHANAVISKKREEDAGYDVYPCFDEEEMVVKPHETKMIPTGLGSCMDRTYYFQPFERGSTGTKGIAQRCGVIDSGFRGEWTVPIDG